jgi:Flp pilus assembly protein TadG
MLAKSESGQAVIEFAIALPVLLLLILGGIDLSRMSSQWGTVQYVAQETSRCEALSGEACKGKTAQAYAIDLASAASLPGAAATTAVASSCGPNCVKVTVDYQFKPVSPFLLHETLQAVAQATGS